MKFNVYKLASSFFILFGIAFSEGGLGMESAPLLWREKNAIMTLEELSWEIAWQSVSSEVTTGSSVTEGGWCALLDRKYTTDTAGYATVNVNSMDSTIRLVDVLPLRKIRNLKYLTLYAQEITPEAMEFILKNLALRELIIEGYQFGDADWRTLAEFQSGICAINVPCSTDFTQQGVDYLKKLPCLRSLTLNMTKSNRVSKLSFEKMQLSRLSLLEDVFLGEIEKTFTIKNCPNLKEIFITGFEGDLTTIEISTLPQLNWLSIELFGDTNHIQIADVPSLCSFELEAGTISQKDLQFLSSIPTDAFQEIALSANHIENNILSVLWNLKPIAKNVNATTRIPRKKFTIHVLSLNTDDKFYTTTTFEKMGQIDVDAIILNGYRFHRNKDGELLFYDKSEKRWRSCSASELPEQVQEYRELLRKGFP